LSGRIGKETIMKIYSRFDKAKILYEDADATSARELVEKAVSIRANLSGANLSDANLFGANLSRAYLTDAYLSDANLSGANLSGADLFGANLSYANLSYADLSGANLSGANLSDANLSDANLSRADLCGVKGVVSPIIQVQGSGHWLTTLPDGRVAIGCEVHTIEEWLSRAEEIGRANNYSEIQIREYQSYLRAVAEVMTLRRKGNVGISKEGRD
jgi:hypothetical protein